MKTRGKRKGKKMLESTRSKPGLKFLWSHQGFLHRMIVRFANKVLRVIPFSIKYMVGRQFKKRLPPYSLLKGRVVVQVGAPFDTLNSGRSRGFYFSQLAGVDGRVLVIEPLVESVEAFKGRLKGQGIKNTIVHNSGAWSEPGESFINVDMNHPATNYTGDTVDYSTEREKEFQKVRIDLDTIDSIVEKYELSNVYLVSVTTNWAEEEILKGMTRLIQGGVKFISLAYGKDGEDYVRLMETLGYMEYSHDDRGITFINKETS